MARDSIIVDLVRAQEKLVMNSLACGLLHAERRQALVMWRHLEPQRLHEATQGAPLLDSEAEHLAFCEVCQELLVMFPMLVLSPERPEKKAA